MNTNPDFNIQPQLLQSAIYQGSVRHRRFLPKAHNFSYGLYMLALDLDELAELARRSRLFALERFAALSFRRRDYLGDPATPLKTAVLNEVAHLGGRISELDRVVMLGQVRCFGLYFSPLNVFFCYQGQQARYALMEVHNTPWNQRHCYLVDLHTLEPTDKDFHVSPFMDMAMQYHWRISPPQIDKSKVLVHIENRDPDLVFDATLSLRRHVFERSVLKAAWLHWPWMTLTIIRGIYWQAVRLFLKRIPYHSPC
ncbi:DUF1365 domain-containing protein [Oceanisphaera avium]|uniref:Chromosome partitioning protein ParA n=1 Tax=Oceanisphaera avium TaxID=1903694 RepID=A0A1Y0CW54_9GAMM|nr:DUF1365 domain-containing protein [Oceanisphaera avium]ART79580.1 chromosome partitioning protein ParA [Oceanisphaera avium]